MLLLLLWQLLPDPRHTKCGYERLLVKIARVRPDQSARTTRVKLTSVILKLLPCVSVLGTGQLPEQTAELKPHRRCTLPLGWEEPKLVEILGSCNTAAHSPHLSLSLGNDKVRTMQSNAVLLSISIPHPRASPANKLTSVITAVTATVTVGDCDCDCDCDDDCV